jgi:hypothetical protein
MGPKESGLFLLYLTMETGADSEMLCFEESQCPEELP